MVAEGTPAVPANAEGRPRDTLDSEQEVATALQSIVHASTAGGVPGLGPGGQSGPGPTGSGAAAGGGSTAHALGTGKGGLVDNDPRDARRTQYLRRVMSKIHPLWKDAFPKWAALEGLQGTVIVTFVITGDGTIERADVTRSSGIAEFDENCRRAVMRAAPFPALPGELGPRLRWSMPFEARNPAVRPKAAGDSMAPSSP
jgi:TonB family protein